MQEIETIANVAEILGGGAILISLMYVGYQIRQSNRIAQAAALHSILEGFSDRALAQTVEHPDTIIMMVRGHHSYDKLSIEEKWAIGLAYRFGIKAMQQKLFSYCYNLVLSN